MQWATDSILLWRAAAKRKELSLVNGPCLSSLVWVRLFLQLNTLILSCYWLFLSVTFENTLRGSLWIKRNQHVYKNKNFTSTWSGCCLSRLHLQLSIIFVVIMSNEAIFVHGLSLSFWKHHLKKPVKNVWKKFKKSEDSEPRIQKYVCMIQALSWIWKQKSESKDAGNKSGFTSSWDTWFRQCH